MVARLRELGSRPDGMLAWASITEIRDAADEELNEQLDRAGVPRR